MINNKCPFCGDSIVYGSHFLLVSFEHEHADGRTVKYEYRLRVCHDCATEIETQIETVCTPAEKTR